MFKVNGATLSFYPNNKTLNVQGTKQEEVRMKQGNLNIVQMSKL